MLNESASITGTDPGSSPPRTTTESLTDALQVGADWEQAPDLFPNAKEVSGLSGD